jgi:hypothetical protein
LSTNFDKIPISPFPEISGFITKVEDLLHIEIGLFGDVQIQGTLSGSESEQLCDKKVEGEVSGSVGVKLGLSAEFSLPGDVVSAEVGGEGGITAKIGGNSSEIGTKIFFNVGTEPLTAGYSISFLSGLIKFEHNIELIPEERLPVVCLLHPEGAPWTTFTSCPAGGE